MFVIFFAIMLTFIELVIEALIHKLHRLLHTLPAYAGN